MTGVAADLAAIKQIIPHRYPVLLVDRVSFVDVGRSLVAHKAVSGREPCYQGIADDADHAYPLGLLIESWAQSAVLLAQWEHPNPDVSTGKVELLSMLNRATVLGQAFPGDVLEHRVTLMKVVDDAAIVSGTTTVSGAPILEVAQCAIARRPLTAL